MSLKWGYASHIAMSGKLMINHWHGAYFQTNPYVCLNIRIYLHV